jgi:hypothetical protein
VAGDVRGVPWSVADCSREWQGRVCRSGGQVGRWAGGQVVRVLVLGEIGVIARAGRLSV